MVSGIALVLLSPLFLVTAMAIRVDSPGPVFYLQERVGLRRKHFKMYKFRSMRLHADRAGLLTIGDTDNRITRVGKFMRRYKLDELPQLINVVKGNMSLVGPRPEVPHFVALYDDKQLQVLDAKPGITDPVSLHFFDEHRLIAGYADPEEGYIREIMPQKLDLNLAYLEHRSFSGDISILFRTVMRIFS